MLVLLCNRFSVCAEKPTWPANRCSRAGQTCEAANYPAFQLLANRYPSVSGLLLAHCLLGLTSPLYMSLQCLTDSDDADAMLVTCESHMHISQIPCLLWYSVLLSRTCSGHLHFAILCTELEGDVSSSQSSSVGRT